MTSGHRNKDARAPLSKHACGVLRTLLNGPIFSLKINPGVIHKIVDEGLAEHIKIPSTYKIDLGRQRNALKITDAGRARINNALRVK